MGNLFARAYSRRNAWILTAVLAAASIFSVSEIASRRAISQTVEQAPVSYESSFFDFNRSGRSILNRTIGPQGIKVTVESHPAFFVLVAPHLRVAHPDKNAAYGIIDRDTGWEYNPGMGDTVFKINGMDYFVFGSDLKEYKEIMKQYEHDPRGMTEYLVSKARNPAQ